MHLICSLLILVSRADTIHWVFRCRLITLNRKKEEKRNTFENVKRLLYQDEVKMEGLRTQRHRLTERMEQLQTVQARLSARQRQLENLEHDKLDPELEKAKCREDNQVPY
jgi:hypothetical protein